MARASFITRKLTWMTMLVTAGALVLACTAFVANDAISTRQSMVARVSAQAQIVGFNSASALVFNDRESAENTLAALNLTHSVMVASIYTPQGQLFAEFSREHPGQAPSTLPSSPGQAETHWFKDGRIALVRPIVFEGKTVGVVYVESSLQEIDQRLKSNAGIALAVLTVSLIAALLMSAIPRRAIAQPIERLAETARFVTREKRYSVRAETTGTHDELSDLIEAFNEMLGQIQDRDSALQRARDELEQRVQERTTELSGANQLLEEEIVDRKRIEVQLAGERDLLHTLMDNVPDYIYFKDVRSRFTRVNLSLARALGLTRPEEAVGRTDFDFFTEEHARQALADEQEILRTSQPLLGKVEEVRRPDGFSAWVDTTKIPIRDATGSVAGLIGIGRDITERNRAEQLLHESEKKFRTLFESIDEGFCIIEMLFDENNKPVDYLFLETNPSFDKQTGIANAVGKRMREIAPQHEEHWFEKYGRIAMTGEPARFENEAAQLHRWYEVYAFRIGEPQQRRVAVLFNDITKRKRSQEELASLNRELERRTVELTASNKELEAFTYSVSHDLRSPLRHIDGFSKLLLEELASTELSEDARRYISRIREGTTQMGQLVDDLLNLARMGRRELSMQVTGLNSLVESVVRDLKQENPSRAIEWSIQTLPFVECDPGLMNQVFVNLLSNAVKYSRPRERAVIEVGMISQGGQPTIFVRDNGVGFNMKYAEKLFGVFQRLHRSEDFEGTGVGLATVQRIIHKHGGRVWAEAALDRGATFYLTLRDQDEKGREQQAQSEEVTHGRR